MIARRIVVAGIAGLGLGAVPAARAQQSAKRFRVGGLGVGTPGLTNDPGQEMHGKLLGLFKEIVPKLSTVGVLAQQGIGYDRAALEAAARQLGLRLDLGDEVRTSDGIADAFAALKRKGVDGYYMIGGPVLFTRRQQVAELALAHRLPGMHFPRDWVEAGCLVSYGASLSELYRRAAVYVDRILKGAKPADLAVELPSRFYLAINLKTARALGLTIPQSVLLRADEVIE